MNKPNHEQNRNRSAGYLIAVVAVLGLAVIGTFVAGRSYSQLALSREPFQRLGYVPSFDPVEDVTLGLPPNSSNLAAGTPAAAIRAIEVYPHQTILLAGGKVVRAIDRSAPRTLNALVELVRNRQWISASSDTVTLYAAVIVERGSSMTIAAPVTSGVVMDVRPGVFLAAYERGTLELNGVYVRASDSGVPDTFSSPSQVAGRPFLLALQDSTITVTDSTFRYLGRDWNSSYGLSWSKGSTGAVTDSTFDHDFIGVYTNDSTGLQVLHDRFYHCSLYGIDPHSGSSRLLIEYDTADYNGRHGIIFSDHVTGSVIQYDTTSRNGLNGIMMDESSTGNVIKHDVVTGNGSVGVVLASSSDNVVAGNSISGNRVGITVRGDTTGTTFAGNKVTGNVLASQGANLAHNTVSGNGGRWLPGRIGVIWFSALVLLLALLSVTRVIQRRPGPVPAQTAVAR